MSVQGLKEIQIGNAEEGKAVLTLGQKERQTTETVLNQTSSRSHSIFTIKIVRDGDAAGCTKLSLVDLAGAERAARTKNQGTKLKEAGKINQSLCHLGQCFEALKYNMSHPGEKAKMVPFRNCKITRLFQDALVGLGNVAMIMNANPARSEQEETQHALRYAAVASQIVITRKVDTGRSGGRRGCMTPDMGAQAAERTQLIEVCATPVSVDTVMMVMIADLPFFLQDLWQEIDDLKQATTLPHFHIIVSSPNTWYGRNLWLCMNNVEISRMKHVKRSQEKWQKGLPLWR